MNHPNLSGDAGSILHRRGVARHVACFRKAVVDTFPREGRVIRADTPPRHGLLPEGKEVLWMLSRPGVSSPRCELIGFIDAVELEMFSGGQFRRRWRFLRDATARHYAQRVKMRLMARGFRERRGRGRTSVWVQ